MFTAHDAGHRGITHNFITDTLIGIFIADFCCGLSIGWWKSSHNVHHLVTNHPVSITSQAISHRIANNVRSMILTFKTYRCSLPRLPTSVRSSLLITTGLPSFGTLLRISLSGTKHGLITQSWLSLVSIFTCFPGVICCLLALRTSALRHGLAPQKS